MIPGTVTAGIFHAVGRPIELRKVELPALSAHQVLVRITCCTICGSDLHTFSGTRSSPTPSVLGHEIVGIIEAISGDELHDVAGNPLHTGDRVTWSVAASCGHCHRCRDDIPQKCESLVKYGHELFSDSNGLNGGLAEYCVLNSGTAIVKLPPEIPDFVVCPANCATATVTAAVGHAGAMNGKRVLVFGAGMLGLTTCAMADAAKAAEVCVCDVNPSRLNTAMQFGATKTCTSVDSDDYDRVFEMSGHPAAVAAAINAAGIGGTVVLVGSVSPSPAVPVDPERIVRRLLSIHGVHNYRPDDLVRAVEFLHRNGEVYPFGNLVEKTYSLSAVNEAFEFAIQQRPIRVAVLP